MLGFAWMLRNEAARYCLARAEGKVNYVKVNRASWSIACRMATHVWAHEIVDRGTPVEEWFRIAHALLTAHNVPNVKRDDPPSMGIVGFDANGAFYTRGPCEDRIYLTKGETE